MCSHGTATFTMARDLLRAIGRLSIHNGVDEKQEHHGIDNMLDQQRPRKRSKQGCSELKKDLEARFLNPSTSFSTAWLNKLQQ